MSASDTGTTSTGVVGRFLDLCRYCPVRQCPGFSWQTLEASRLDFCQRGILCFLEVRPPAHRRASTKFFSETSRLRCARDLGSGIARALPSGPNILVIPPHGRLALPPPSHFLGLPCAPGTTGSRW